MLRGPVKLSSAEVSKNTCRKVRRYSDEDILSALREAARLLGRPPGVKSYSKMRRFRSSWPTVTTVIVHFGSWRKALESVGMPCFRRSPAQKKYGSEEMISSLQRAAADGIYSYPAYDEYARENRLPRAETIKRRFKTWNAAKKAAGILSAKERNIERIKHALPKAQEILAERPFLVSSDAEVLGLTAKELKFLAVENGFAVVHLHKFAPSLLKAAESGFPDVGDPVGRSVAIALTQGKTLAGIGREMGLCRERVRQIAVKYCRRVGTDYCPSHRSESTKDFLENKLPNVLRSLAKELGRRPRKKDYDMIREPGWPSAEIICRHVGKWRDVVSQSLGDRFTAERIFNIITSLALELGRLPKMSDYKALRRRNPNLPNISFVYRVFGSWGELVNQCFVRILAAQQKGRQE